MVAGGIEWPAGEGVGIDGGVEAQVLRRVVVYAWRWDRVMMLSIPLGGRPAPGLFHLGYMFVLLARQVGRSVRPGRERCYAGTWGDSEQRYCSALDCVMKLEPFSKVYLEVNLWRSAGTGAD
jgi:hypothetical protein